MGTFKAKYLGESDGPVRAFGTVFEDGKASDVEDRFAAKVGGNRFFKVEGEPVTAGNGNAPVLPDGPFAAKEKSAGWWAIYDGKGNEVGKSIREADAKSFNDMNDADKTAYVKAELESN